MPGFHDKTAEIRAIYRQMWIMKHCKDNDLDIEDPDDLKSAERSYLTYRNEHGVNDFSYDRLKNDICDFALIDGIDAYVAVRRYEDRVNPQSWESIVKSVTSDVISSVEERAKSEALDFHEWNDINNRYLSDRDRDLAALYENTCDGDMGDDDMEDDEGGFVSL